MPFQLLLICQWIHGNSCAWAHDEWLVLLSYYTYILHLTHLTHLTHLYCAYLSSVEFEHFVYHERYIYVYSRYPYHPRYLAGSFKMKMEKVALQYLEKRENLKKKSKMRALSILREKLSRYL